MVCVVAVEAKVIGNSVHFAFRFFFLFFFFCLFGRSVRVFRIASSLSLVCQFNFGHDPLFTWWFSSRQFRRESNISVERRMSVERGAHTIAAIMCTMLRKNCCCCQSNFRLASTHTHHTHSARHVWIRMNMVRCEYRNASNYNDECVFILSQHTICNNANVYVPRRCRPFASHPHNYTQNDMNAESIEWQQRRWRHRQHRPSR